VLAESSRRSRSGGVVGAEASNSELAEALFIGLCQLVPRRAPPHQCQIVHRFHRPHKKTAPPAVVLIALAQTGGDASR
jgi:hypothetical protein